MKTLEPILSVAILATVCLSVRGAELADSIQAVVNDVPVTQQAVERVVGREEEAIYRRFSTQPEILNKQVIALRQDGADLLIDQEVILHDFTENLKVPDSIIDAIVTDRMKEYVKLHYNGDNSLLTKQLESEGVTLDQFRKQFRESFIIEQMRLKNVPEPIISPRKIEDYYTQHPEEFKLEDQIKMRLIFLKKDEDTNSVRQRAGEILSQINGGASFEEMARAYSEGSLRADGGETGWEDLSVVNKTLLEPINQLKPGEHSGVIEAPEGFYLLLLEDRHAAHVKTLSEVRPLIERKLAAEETARLSKQWIARLKKKTFVRIF